MDIVLQRFFHYEGEVRAFGAIAIVVFACVAVLFDGIGKHLFCLFDLHADLGQVSQLHGGAVLGNERFQIEPVKMKITVFYIEPFLGKVKGLFNQVGVRVVHVLVQVADSREF